MRRVKDVMTRTVEVVAPDATLVAAAERMGTLDVGALPVREDDHLVGIVTDRDIAVRAIAQGIDPAITKVADVMTKDVVACFEDQSVEDAARLMAEKQIRRLVVLSRRQRLVGIISLGDLAVDTGDDQLAGEVLEHVSAKVISRRHPYEHIMVTLDGSRLAEEVLPYVESLARQFGSKVTMLRVMTPVEAVFMAQAGAGAMAAGRSAAEFIPVTEEMRQDTVHYLAATKHDLESRGLRVEYEYPEAQEPAAGIIQRARHLGVDLIAMTTHGRGGLGRAVFGSVADEVLRRAPCPVLLVRAGQER